MELEECLKMHRIYRNRFTNMPKHLAALVTAIQTSRTGPPSPKSQQVARASMSTCNMSQLDALIHLENHLGYVPAFSLTGDGEEYIFRSHSQLWSANSVPRPNTKYDKILEATLETLGSPPRPKPDIVYGYTTSSFSFSDKVRLERLSSSTRVIEAEPLFPFLILEWKSYQGNPQNCELQAMRDGAAAVNALRQFFIETGTRQPREDETAVFCTCVNARTIDIFVSWRRDDPEDPEGVSWEMDRLYGGYLESEDMVFHARSILLNILDWARQQRLERIKAALQPCKRGLIVDKEDSSPKRRRRG
jgi:hypothetical protein